MWVPRVPVPGEATGIVVAFDHVKPCVVGPQFLVKNGCDIDECQPTTTHVVGRSGHPWKPTIWVVMGAAVIECHDENIGDIIEHRRWLLMAAPLHMVQYAKCAPARAPICGNISTT
eukprot:COSAG01_NODE_1740_length_9359_cov_6.376998_6_plen_116_part_00